MSWLRVAATAVTVTIAGLGWPAGCRISDVDGPVAVAHVFWNNGIPTLGPPAWDDSSIYFATRAHSVVAVNRQTGLVRWTAHCCVTGDWVTTRRTPARTANVLVFGDDDLAGFDAVTGVQLWRFTDDNGQVVRAGVVPFSADGGRVYTGSYVGAAFAIDATSGSVLWRTDLVQDTSAQVRVHAARDTCVYLSVRFKIGTFYYAKVYALNAATGSVLWSYDVGASSLARDIVLTPVPASTQLLLVARDDGSVVALATSDGSERWTATHPVQPGPSDRRISVSGNTVIASATPTTAGLDLLVAYDLSTGTELWRTASEQGSVEGYYNSLASDQEHMYAMFTNGVLGTYDLLSGQPISFRRAPSGIFYGAPAISHDTLFLAGSEGAFAIAR